MYIVTRYKSKQIHFKDGNLYTRKSYHSLIKPKLIATAMMGWQQIDLKHLDGTQLKSSSLSPTNVRKSVWLYNMILTLIYNWTVSK